MSGEIKSQLETTPADRERAPLAGDVVALATQTRLGEIEGVVAGIGKRTINLAFHGGKAGREDNVTLADFLNRYTWDERAQRWSGEDDPPPPAFESRAEETPAALMRIADLEVKVAELMKRAGGADA